jgi:hypothetical protein
MDDLKLPGDEKEKKSVSFNRLAIWVCVGGIAVYMIISGIVGGIQSGSF